MRNRALAIATAAVLALTGCAATTDSDSDPMLNCINAGVDYGLSEDRQESADFCQWLKDNVNLPEGPFDEVFASPESAAEWAQAELAKP